MIKPERIEDLSPEQLKGIMERSMEDISTVYEEMRKIVEDIRENGDAVSLEHYKKHKEDISLADLEATRGEIEEAYKQLDSKVV
ncbi:MAG: histidinol dehydrogenase, partial [Desulfobacteraceae bacterium]